MYAAEMRRGRRERFKRKRHRQPFPIRHAAVTQLEGLLSSPELTAIELYPESPEWKI